MTITVQITRSNDSHDGDLLMQRQDIVNGVVTPLSSAYDVRLKKGESVSISVWDARTFSASEVPALPKAE